MKTSKTAKGFSLVEIIIVVAIIGVLAALAIPSISGTNEAAQLAQARDHVEGMNKALRTFSQSCWEIKTPADNNATTDEFIVLRSLQYRFPVSNMRVGSPYYEPRYNPVASSSSSDWRIRWNGATFEIIARGASGTGLLLSQKGTDFAATAYTFPSGYKPAGAP